MTLCDVDGRVRARFMDVTVYVLTGSHPFHLGGCLASGEDMVPGVA